MKDNEFKIYIMLTQTNTVFSKMIKLYTKAPYNHVSIGLDKNLNYLYSFGRRKLTKPWNAGLVKENIIGGVYSAFKETECEVYKIDVTFKQFYEVSKHITSFLEEYEKYRYNFIGLIPMMLDLPYNRKYHFACSQFVSKILKESGVMNFEKDTSLVTPDDFRQINKMNLIYKGKLKDYCRNNISLSFIQNAI